MTDVVLSAESQEISDASTRHFSILGFFSFAISLIGLFSFGFFQVIPFSILGGALGAIALMRSSRQALGTMSKIYAVLGTVIGVTVVSAVVFQTRLDNAYDLVHAKKTCQLYLESLSSGDERTVVYLRGADANPNPADMKDNSSPAAIAWNTVKTDPVHKEVRFRLRPSKWTFVEHNSDYAMRAEHVYKLTYRDDGQPSKPEYFLFVRKDCKKSERKPKVHWYVDTLVRTDMK